MATSFGALCTDFSVSHKLALKMDLPYDRETILHLFDRVRKSVPAMDRFHPYDDELALESSRRDRDYRVLSIRQTSIRSGISNPDTMEQAYDFHSLIMQLAPYHLTISPLDIDHVDVSFAFDLECNANHDEVIYEALLADSPLGGLLDIHGAKLIDVQPYFTLALDEKGDRQAFFEIKTRNRSPRGRSSRYKHEPISLFLTVRKFGPVGHVDDLHKDVGELGDIADQLTAEKFIPLVVLPVSRQVSSNSA